MLAAMIVRVPSEKQRCQFRVASERASERASGYRETTEGPTGVPLGGSRREQQEQRGREIERERASKMVVGTTDESVEKLSTKLLQGWTMLSETCPLPKCSVPLMRNRSNTEVGVEAGVCWKIALALLLFQF